MQAGLIKWFDNEKGFGVIGVPGGTEIFLHRRGFVESPLEVKEGEAVVFETRIDPKKNRETAHKCQFVRRVEDWHLAMRHLGGEEQVVLQDHRKKANLVTQAGRQLFAFGEATTFFEILSRYFDEGLNRLFFVPFCKHITAWAGKIFSPEDAVPVLDRLWAHFAAGMDSEVVFRAWKAQQFRFIGLPADGDFEIPEEVLRAHVADLELSDLGRINGYSFGEALVGELLPDYLDRYRPTCLEEFEPLFSQLVLLEGAAFRALIAPLQDQWLSLLKAEIEVKAAALPPLGSEAAYRQYQQLAQQLPLVLTAEAKGNLQEYIQRIMLARVVPEYRPTLWLKGIGEQISIEEAETFFLEAGYNKEQQAAILRRFAFAGQQRLLDVGLNEWGSVRLLQILKAFVASLDGAEMAALMEASFFKEAFWESAQSGDLVRWVPGHLIATLGEAEIARLFSEKVLPVIPESLFLGNLGLFDAAAIQRFLSTLPADAAFVKGTLLARLDNGAPVNISGIYRIAKDLLEESLFLDFDREAALIIAPADYYKLWKQKEGKVVPVGFLKTLLTTPDTQFKEVADWIAPDLLSEKALVTLLRDFLKTAPPVHNRGDFYFQYHCVHFLALLNSWEEAYETGTDFHKLVFWSLDRDVPLDFDFLKSKFIYFSPQHQVRLVRKLFHMLATGKARWTIKELAGLTRFDLDLYKLSKEYNPELDIDISTDVVLQSLLSFKHTGKFLMEGALLKVVLEDLSGGSAKRFQLANYFEECAGRMEATIDRDTNGNISLIERSGQQLFLINFEYDDHFVKQIKALPGRQYDANKKCWLVPVMYKKEVLEFGVKNKFFINAGDGNKAINEHLLFYNRQKDKPNGIEYCEGRKAIDTHFQNGQEFWWCTNQACFQNCETVHEPENWERYTLLDFCLILGFNLDDRSVTGELVARGHYTMFISRINRFNRLLKRLFCYECDEILYPADIGLFAFYTVVRFKCVTEKCDCNSAKDVVYLNHCMNGQCNNVIDSRVSASCTHGLYICDKCGSCCSHTMFVRRLNNLKTNGGYIYPELVYNVENKTGHLERAEYYCHRSSTHPKMKETSPNVFRCESCNQVYDTTKYHFKRIHRHLVNPLMPPPTPEAEDFGQNEDFFPQIETD